MARSFRVGRKWHSRPVRAQNLHGGVPSFLHFVLFDLSRILAVGRQVRYIKRTGIQHKHECCACRETSQLSPDTFVQSGLDLMRLEIRC